MPGVKSVVFQSKRYADRKKILDGMKNESRIIAVSEMDEIVDVVLR